MKKEKIQSIKLLNTNNVSILSRKLYDKIKNDLNGSFLSLSGGALTGNTTLTTGANEAYYLAKRSDTGTEVWMGIGSGGINHGIYSRVLDGWLMYCDGVNTQLNGNASTATKLKTGRVITIGNTNRTFDGSGNITWTLTDIGAAAVNHTHTSNQISDATNTNKANMLVKRDGNGNFSAGTITASLSGNASTATKLQNARTINGTSFDGTGNITTSNWGTARNIQIGNTSKSVNGSANVSWSLSEIGALPLNGGTINGVINSTYETGTHLNGNQGKAIINSTASAGAYTMLAKMNSTNGYFTFGT